MPRTLTAVIGRGRRGLRLASLSLLVCTALSSPARAEKPLDVALFGLGERDHSKTWEGNAHGWSLAPRPSDAKVGRRRYRLSYLIKDVEGRFQRAGALLVVRGDRLLSVPRVALDASMPSGSASAASQRWAAKSPALPPSASKAVVERGFRALDAALKGLGLQGKGGGYKLRVRPMFTTADKADWIVRVAPGDGQPSSSPDLRSVRIYGGNQPAIVAAQQAIKTFATPHDRAAAPAVTLHSLGPFAQVVSVLTGARLTPANRGPHVSSRLPASTEKGAPSRLVHRSARGGNPR